jgi:hypothetical protein
MVEAESAGFWAENGQGQLLECWSTLIAMLGRGMGHSTDPRFANCTPLAYPPIVLAFCWKSTMHW